MLNMPVLLFLCLKTIKPKAVLCVVNLISVHWRFNGHDFELCTGEKRQNATLPGALAS